MPPNLPPSVRIYIRQEKARIRRTAASEKDARTQIDALQRRFHPQARRGILSAAGEIPQSLLRLRLRKGAERTPSE